jgi:NAD-dependent DNA ligase
MLHAGTQPLHTTLKDLSKYDDAYYQGEPLITDAEYDRLAAAAGRRGVGSAARAKIRHSRPMLSLRREHDPLSWHAEIGAPPVIVQPKVDGMACAVVFESGKLVLALSRGDGRMGCDITAAVADSGAVQVPQWFTGELRGELYTPLSVWRERKKYRTPQSDVAALVMAGRTATSGIQFQDHDAAPILSRDIAQALAIVEPTRWVGGMDDVPMDGVVVKVADPVVRAKMGDDGVVPLWGIAVKP